MNAQTSRSPSYLSRNPYLYCFRMFVPKDLQRFLGEKGLPYPFRTGYLGDTKVDNNSPSQLKRCVGFIKVEIKGINSVL
jgi:hypothetical protein